MPFTLKRSVAKGDEQVVRVTGLESGEQVRVKFRGEKVDAGEANANGKFTAPLQGDRRPWRGTCAGGGSVHPPAEATRRSR